MIHLDANFLIQAAQRKSQVQTLLRSWLQQGESFSVSAVAWTEFLNGPLTSENKLDGNFIVEGRIIPFRQPEAELAGRLFNSTGRKRGSVPDCLIAATAIQARASFATFNRRDFASFVPFGLRLA
jgi:predicted nucleic acid-binding protein